MSCSAPGACTAVGFGFVNGTTEINLAERWNGTRWVIQKTPAVPASSQTSLGTVSCPAANSCMALGSYRNTNGAFLPLIEHWNGTRWVIESAPLPAGVQLNSLSCPSATSCTAVGRKLRAVAVHWNGSTWTAKRLPVPTAAIGGSLILSDVSCPSARVCEALGFFHARSTTGGFKDVTIIEAN